MDWYVVYALDKDAQDIVNFFDCQKDIDAFIPQVEKFMNRKGVKGYESFPMFPNSIFLKTSLAKSTIERKMRSWRKDISAIVTYLDYNDMRTVLLKPSEQQYLESVLDEDFTMRHSMGIIKDDQLIIVDGPLVGKEALVKKIDRHKRQAFLDVDLLGILVKVPLEITQRIYT